MENTNTEAYAYLTFRPSDVPFKPGHYVITDPRVVTTLDPIEYNKMMVYVTLLCNSFVNDEVMTYDRFVVLTTKLLNCYSFAGIPYSLERSTVVTEEVYSKFLIEVETSKQSKILRDFLRCDIGSPMEEMIRDSQFGPAKKPNKNSEYQSAYRMRKRMVQAAEGEGSQAEIARQWLQAKEELAKMTKEYKNKIADLERRFKNPNWMGL